MSEIQGQLERRKGQRFDTHIPVSVCLAGDRREVRSFTQNVSARGLLLCTSLPLAEMDVVELHLTLPSEITMTENARIQCRGRILRVNSAAWDGKYLAAIHMEQVEFLPDAEALPVFRQVVSTAEPQALELEAK